MILADTHIHLGLSRRGEPVKVSASRNLTLAAVPGILQAYGADLGAVVDLGTSRGLRDLEEGLAKGELREAEDGAFVAPVGSRILGALEAEFRLGESGPFHLLAYAPGLDGLREVERLYRASVRNSGLSTQRMHLAPEEFRRGVEAAGGVLVVAHAFTPHRGLFGVGLTLDDAFERPQGIGIELGLSADVAIVRHVGAVGDLGLMGGSDAHGPDTVGRELNAVPGSDAGFSVMRRLVAGEAATIFGMNPAFGKYHRTFCPVCGAVVTGDPPQFSCPRDGTHRVVAGVLDRAMAMAPPKVSRNYPDYVYQLPLSLLPGVGPAARRRLTTAFAGVHQALHEASAAELDAILGPDLARTILAMRAGEPPQTVGGGGHWGKARA